MNGYDSTESFLSLFLSALAMFTGLSVLTRQVLLMAFSLAGWSGVGVMLTLIAVALFGLHLWLEEAAPKFKYRYGR